MIDRKLLGSPNRVGLSFFVVDSTMGLAGIKACSSAVKRVHSPKSIRPSRRLAAIKAYRGMSMCSVSVWLTIWAVFRYGVISADTPGVTANDPANSEPTAG